MTFFLQTTKQRNKFKNICFKKGISLFSLFSDTYLVTLNFRDPAGQTIVFFRQANTMMSNLDNLFYIVVKIME